MPNPICTIAGSFGTTPDNPFVIMALAGQDAPCQNASPKSQTCKAVEAPSAQRRTLVRLMACNVWWHTAAECHLNVTSIPHSPRSLPTAPFPHLSRRSPRWSRIALILWSSYKCDSDTDIHSACEQCWKAWTIRLQSPMSVLTSNHQKRDVEFEEVLIFLQVSALDGWKFIWSHAFCRVCTSTHFSSNFLASHAFGEWHISAGCKGNKSGHVYVALKATSLLFLLLIYRCQKPLHTSLHQRRQLNGRYYHSIEYWLGGKGENWEKMEYFRF